MAIKLITGLNGTFKTATTLWDFLHAPEYEGRPKYALPIKDFDPEKHGVKPLTAEQLQDWASLPDGSVILVDEAQDYFPARGRAEPPLWINELAKHRHRGMDFLLTCPNAMMIDSFVRRLVKPHVHMLRPWNLKNPSKWTWEEVQNNPTSDAARKTGLGESVTINPEVFSVYTSTVLDTHTSRFPAKIKMILAAVVVGIICIVVYMFWWKGHFAHVTGVNTGVATKPTQVVRMAQPESVNHLGQDMTPNHDVEWNAKNMVPRIHGLPWTAPVYDGISQPSDFPRIAACMVGTGPDHPCACYTQQGTPLDEDEGFCRAVVKHGIFDPWQTARRNAEQHADMAAASGAPVQPCVTVQIQNGAPAAPAVAEQAAPDPIHDAPPPQLASSYRKPVQN